MKKPTAFTWPPETLTRTLFATITRSTENYLEKKMRNVDTLCKDMAYFLLEKLEETGDEDLDMYNKAVELIGLDEVVRMKLDNDWALWHDDKEYIKSHL